jgi:outer membrane receptor for ferrienterochelin and colicin
MRVAGGNGFKSPDFKQMYRDDWVHTGGILYFPETKISKPTRMEYQRRDRGNYFRNTYLGGWSTRGPDFRHDYYPADKFGYRLTARGQHYDAVRRYVNADSAFTRGFDISLYFTPSPLLQIKTAYSFLDSRYWDESGTLTKSELFSPHTIKASVHYQPLIAGTYKPSFMGDILWQSSQKYLSQPDGELAAFADINIAVDLPVTSIGSITIGAKNILDNDLAEWNQATGRKIFTEVTLSIYDITKPFNYYSGN